ncbi:MAG: ribosome-associated translation inhibitor RaiA [Dermatophilus congolensis]|nr:ribosome-associated translation inhibitor RaiA [Dermatophilus congolensis]
MELTVTARHVQVSERFRRLCGEKLTKIEQYAPRTQRVEVVVSEETSRGAPKGSERVEITCIAKGPILRAEAYADDKYSALDLALDKLSERIRRANTKKKVKRRSGPDIDAATADLAVAKLGSNGSEPAADVAETDELDEMDAKLGASGDSPIHVREKVHSSTPMSLDQALYSMELVGHDFFLYQDKDTGRPSVVYRRRGWDYGVIHLEITDELPAEQAG